MMKALGNMLSDKFSALLSQYGLNCSKRKMCLSMSQLIFLLWVNEGHDGSMKNRSPLAESR